MLCDARRLSEGQVLQSTVCIIGAGPAGLTMAMEFERHGIETIVLESGGFKPDPATMDLYRGENVGIPYQFSDGFRSRFLGGGSNCWGGWCRPLDVEDLQPRSWVPHSGWPIDREELMPFYDRAHSVLSLGPPNFEMDHWVKAIGRSDVRRMPLPTGRVEDSLSQFSRPTRFGKHYRNELKQAKHIKVYLHANVTDIETETTGQTVKRVHVQTVSGRKLTVEARQFVLATGGIENARVLLACNKQHANGLGNANDLVGRFFMEHPRLYLHKVKFRPAWLRNKLYDIKFHYLNRAVSANGTHIAAQMAITPETQKREGLLNARIWFHSIFPGEGTDAAAAIVRMKHRLHSKVDPQHGFWGDLATMAKQPIDSLNFIAARQVPEWITRELQFHAIKEAQFQMICEPTPDPDSRISLSSQKDALGMPRVKVDWRLDDRVKRTFDRSLEIIADELCTAGIADVSFERPLLGNPWPENLEGTWHHMGTTRMHESPRQGVVDPNSRIHGMSNMYVAGSSVFPTAGANFPTFTLVALSLRLADHLVGTLRAPDASASVAGSEFRGALARPVVQESV
ncbi:FAD-dependent oxidoreductase [Methylibium petroleiphilum]|uniref:FAD-dependent oxidoreductase n=1 Tax=Methylibium petroleiphilum TaxID=105560 RepID=UPI001AC3CF11|nr:GMC family oxidoreductase [Methylibium petroleiphilum]MBN9205441.1 GMC family oxidoreductase [Methylibium petroleiphilum]